MRAVRFHQFGGPSVLHYETVPDPLLGPQDALVRVFAAGVNHLDLDVRSGTSRWPISLPHIPGTEFAGEVVEVGTEVRDLEVGTPVVANAAVCGRCRYCRTARDNLCPHVRNFGLTMPGAYAELVAAPQDSLIPLPTGVSFEGAACAQLNFGTAWHMLITRSRLRTGETVLVNAAASSVGVAAVQIAHLAGGRVIASAGSAKKLEIVRALGAEEVIDYTTHDLEQEVLRLTGGQGVDLIFEHVGGGMFGTVLNLLAADGRMVLCGGHAGEVVELDLIPFFRRELQLIGSRRATRQEMVEVLGLLERGLLKPVIDTSFPLSKARSAHELIEARRNAGKLLLLPQAETDYGAGEDAEPGQALVPDHRDP